MALTFIRMRAEAVLLRKAGWDAVPLLRRYPSLVVMARDSTAAIRGWRGTVHLRAGFGALGPITAAEGSHSGVRRRGEREVAGGRSGWR